MRHVVGVNGRNIRVEFGCYHPEIENNTCPTGKGDCSECEHCKAEIGAADALFLINRETE